ncbi:hypothetical protein [Sulfurospirillum sp.]|uniref:hypothetical protein n=1 Tax=Sulfurospirillum sp. TaxID=2053622 RepID=UPI002FDE0F8F
MEANHPISSFPKDNIKRVIWWYGPIIENTQNLSLPLVKIAAKQILEDGKTLSDVNDILYATVAELDQTRLGTIWKGQNSTSAIWKNHKYFSYNKQFDFVFSDQRLQPTSVTLDHKIPDKTYWHISKFKYDIGKFPENSNDFVAFCKSRLTKIISTNDITVYIPSLEFLTSAIAPGHKQIRTKLILDTIDVAIEKYIKSAFINESGDYEIELNEGKTDENIILLSYLKLNQTSRSRLSHVWASIQQDHSKGYMNPVVLPYHPTNLTLVGDGVWIDNSTFLMLRINQASLPIDHKIISEDIKYDIKPKKETVQYIPRPHELSEDNEDDGQDITHKHNPHTTTGFVRAYSQVETIGTPPTIIEHNKIIEIESPSYEKGESDKNPLHLSSGETNNQKDSEETAQIKQAHIEHNQPTQFQGFKAIEDALALLTKNDEDLVSGFSYITLEGIESSFPEYCSIKSSQLLQKSVLNRWHILKKIKGINGEKKTILRKFLIIHIYLKDNSSAYLLEIQEKNNEGFSRLFFNTPDKMLSPTIILDLLCTIVSNKGNYSKYVKKDTSKPKQKGKLTKLPLPVQPSITYKHFATIPTDKQLRNAIQKAIQKHVFY